MAIKTPFKFIRRITSDEIVDNPTAVLREQYANLMRPNKFDGVLEYEATVRHSYTIDNDGTLLESLKERFSNIFGSYSYTDELPAPKRHYICFVEEVCNHLVDPSVYKKDLNKKAEALLQLPKFILSQKLRGGKDGTINNGSSVRVRFYDTTLISSTGEIVGEIVSLGPQTETQEDPFGTVGSDGLSGGSPRKAMNSNPNYEPQAPEISQAEIDADAAAFDNPALQNQPLPPINLAFINSLNPDFQKIVKSFVLRCWEQLAIEIVPSSGYRSVKTQREMRKRWEAGPRNTPAPAPVTDDSASFHNAGLAFDFNPRITSTGKVLTTRNTKEEWIGSGIGSIISQLGLKWGIDFRTNYDPIHVDMSSILGWGGKDVVNFIKASEEQGIEVNRWPVQEYVSDPLNPPNQTEINQMSLYPTSNIDSDKQGEATVTVSGE
jgi:hypothetical protein